MNIHELFVNIRDTFVISSQMSAKFSLQSSVYVILHEYLSISNTTEYKNHCMHRMHKDIYIHDIPSIHHNPH